MRIVRSPATSVVVLVVFASISPWRRHRDLAGAVEVDHVAEPRSQLTMIRTHEQLAEAARRAARFERSLAERAAERAAEYEALAGDEPTGTVASSIHRLPDASRRSERHSA